MGKSTTSSKKKKAPLTAVERMEEMALVSQVTEGLSPHLQGLTDKTLSEFVINLTEQQIKKSGVAAATTTATNQVQQSQDLRARLQENGAPDIPLSLCKKLLEWTESQSPRIKRWKKKQP